MKQDALAKWLKFIIVGVGFCGLLTYTVIMPRFAAYLVRQNSMLEKNVLPWLILIWISAIPCYAVLVLGWKIADNISKDRSFSYENAEYLKWVSYLSMGDSVFVFLANIIFLLLDMSAAAVMLVICIIVFAGIYYCLRRNIHIHLRRSPFSSGGQSGGNKRGERSYCVNYPPLSLSIEDGILINEGEEPWAVWFLI